MTVYSIAVVFSYVFERLIIGSITSFDFSGRSVVFYISFAVMVLQYVVLALGLLVFGKKKEELKKIDYRQSDTPISEWFIPERRYDLFRLEEYLTFENVVGINGQWGAGKTEIKKEFYRRHSKDIYPISIDVLTCNEDELDVFLLNIRNL